MTRYRDGRGSPRGILTRKVLALVVESGDRGVDQARLVDRLVRLFPELDHTHVRRHITRMTSGRYRDRLVLDDSGTYRFTSD